MRKSLLEEVQELEATAVDPGAAVLRDASGRRYKQGLVSWTLTRTSVFIPQYSPHTNVIICYCSLIIFPLAAQSQVYISICGKVFHFRVALSTGLKPGLRFPRAKAVRGSFWV